MNNNVRKVTSENYPTDAGREGELIFRLVYQQTGCKKSVSRLWLSSMEESAIREGFANLKPSTEYDALYNAALCRERADWMVDINASRLFSCLYGRPLAVGRVMTPVLAMTVVREAEIAAFTPEKFYTVALAFAGGGTASSRRFSQKADAEALLTSCRKEACAVVQDAERKEKSENPPQLYDLTTLQRDANRLLGFTAQQTLNYAQSLYEKRLITYPRTDSRFLTEDMAEALPGLASGTAAIFGAEEKLLVHVQQVINGSKVTDHHALLPTEKGRVLVTVMPEQIQSPEMTADWENKLLRIERGEMEPEEFMTEIKEMVSSLVNTAEAVKGANALILYRGNLLIGKRSVPQPELSEQLYQKFNCAQPMDYHGHSLSVSDVILLNQAGKISAHYVDSIGFRELSGFQDKQERSSVLSQLKAKCDMPECNPTKCRKGRNDHAI